MFGIAPFREMSAPILRPRGFWCERGERRQSRGRELAPAPAATRKGLATPTSELMWRGGLSAHALQFRGVEPNAATTARADIIGIYTSSLSPREEWGERWREGNLNKPRLLSPPLSSFLRQEEREKCSPIGHFSVCVDTNGEKAGVRGK